MFWMRNKEKKLQYTLLSGGVFIQMGYCIHIDKANFGAKCLLLWPNICYSAPSQFKNEQKLPKIVNNIPNSIALQFGDNFMKIRLKIAKLHMFTFTH